MEVISKVWFAPIEEGFEKNGISNKVLNLYEEIIKEKENNPDKDDFVAVKIHFGEQENIGYVKPDYLSKLLSKIKLEGSKPYFTDANTLYEGQRDNAVDHSIQAHEHGFTFENTGLPVIIADGLLSKNYTEVEISETHFDRVSIANDILHSDYLLSIAHVTGSPATGFGATLKNLGMGCASRSGKQLQHADVKPKIDREKCEVCGSCVKWCPVDAISIKEGKYAIIDEETCYGCAECLTVCSFDAVSNLGDSTTKLLQEKIAEYTLGVLKDKGSKNIFYNFLTHVTEGCDCSSEPQEKVIDDIGIMASTDPVAIDQASIDLLNEKTGKDLFKELQGMEYTYQLKHAKKIGLGERDYELSEI
ncbi:DUF362 domain-containing protein [Candidatus Bipolaricaulota bacterium]|nr:DUF362 domain-containing protein [Candidatus Bipolaricaulota bacterium]